jgi:uncharacterized protein (TIGR03437 family)
MPKMRTLPLLVLAGLILAPLSSGQTSYPYAINTLAGSGSSGDGGPAISALLEFPLSVAADGAGNFYLSDSGNSLIRVVNSAGTIRTFVTGYAVCLKTDSTGAVYGSDGVSKVYKISPKGVLTVIAGAGVGFYGDNGPAAAASLSAPTGIAIDALNNVYIADTLNQRVREITPDGIIQTIAGNGTAAYGKEGVTATTSPLAYPSSVEVDAAGNVYIGELYRIRKLTPNGLISTVAGNGSTPADGPAINSAIGSMVGLAVDASSNLYLADADYNMVRMISPIGRITTLAGSQSAGFSGDGSSGSRAFLDGPIGVSVDPKGNIYIADEYNHRIRMLAVSGIISTVAGSTHFAGDGGPATTALLHRPEHAVKDSAGNLYISDTDNNRIRKVGPTGVISTYAGTGACSYGGDNGLASLATLCQPEGLAFDATGNLYVADWGNCVVRRIDTKGIITTYAGSGTCGAPKFHSTTASVQFEGPYGLAFDSLGDLYISDNTANIVMRVCCGGDVDPFAGTGTAGSGGDGGLALSAKLNAPAHLAFGPDGSLYISDGGNNSVRKVTTQLIITTVVGAQSCCAAGNPSGISLTNPDGLFVDASSDVYVAWTGSDVLTKTTSSGATSIIAGSGADGFTGDGGLAANAALSGPAGLWQDTSGDLYLADYFNNRVRKLTVDSLTGMAATSGDNQSGNVQTALPKPLAVTLTFRAGVGIPGIPVSFAVTSGTAILSAQTTTTDASGSAGVAVTLGSTAGPIVVTATTAGASPVTFHLTATPVIPLPTIGANGIVGAGGSTPPVTELSPGGFATIYGSNFAPAGTFAQAQGSVWPTQLAGVCVLVNGTAAFVTFVSPTQINFQAPSIPVNTTVTVQVESNCGAADALESAVQPVATLPATPEFLYWVKNASGQNPVVAVNAVTNAYIGAVGLIPGLTFVPAKAGDILTIYGVSFGATNPAVVPGTPPAAGASSVYTAAVQLGTLNLDPGAILYAGVSPGTAGLYQLNIQVPQNLPDGDYPLVLTLGAFSTPAGGFITVKN